MEIRLVAYDHPDATTLVAELQQEFVQRYGDTDETPVEVEEFSPPYGAFFVGYDDGTPVACGAWRRHRPTDDASGPTGELKRLYVAPTARGRGYARLMVSALEWSAGAHGIRRLVLVTGTPQPESIALYRSRGYTPTEPFGHYADDPDSVFLAKDLDEADEATA